MGALAASIASHLPSGVSAAVAALAASPGEVVRRAAGLEDELRELLRLNGGGRGRGGAAAGRTRGGGVGVVAMAAARRRRQRR